MAPEYATTPRGRPAQSDRRAGSATMPARISPPRPSSTACASQRAQLMHGIYRGPSRSRTTPGTGRTELGLERASVPRRVLMYRADPAESACGRMPISGCAAMSSGKRTGSFANQSSVRPSLFPFGAPRNIHLQARARLFRIRCHIASPDAARHAATGSLAMETDVRATKLQKPSHAGRSSAKACQPHKAVPCWSNHFWALSTSFRSERLVAWARTPCNPRNAHAVVSASGRQQSNKRVGQKACHVSHVPGVMQECDSAQMLGERLGLQADMFDPLSDPLSRSSGAGPSLSTCALGSVRRN